MQRNESPEVGTLPRLLPVGLLLGALLLPILSLQAPAQSALYAFDGKQTSATLGSSVAAVGDVNKDGVVDLLVGDPSFDAGGPFAGRAVLYSGLDGSVLATVHGNSADDRLGVAVAGAGDVNADGWPDWIVGAEMDAVTGTARVFSGADGSELHLFLGSSTLSYFGSAVAGAGDVDGDGCDDLIVGSRGSNAAGPDSGCATVYSGKTGAPIHVLKGDSPYDFMGWSVAGVGDVDADGYADVVVGATGSDQSAPEAGMARLYSGRYGTILHTCPGTGGGDQLGGAVGPAGDFDGDTVLDFAAGAAQPGSGAGYVLVLSGADGAVLHTLSGDAYGDAFGESLACPGDVDGDGRPDLLVGAPGAAGLTGLARAFSGQGGGLLMEIGGQRPGDRFGHAVAGAGDLNVDGKGDLIVGAPGAEGPGTRGGTAWVFLSCSPAPLVYCTPKITSTGCTPSVSFSGAASLSVGDNFELVASDLINHSIGILTWGLGPASVPFAGGTLCVQSPMMQLPPQMSGGTQGGPSDCTGTLRAHFSQAYMAQKGLSAGAAVYAQFWCRDRGFAAPDDIALTDAVEFTVCP